MSKHEVNVDRIASYLTRHRNVPPEREGWFSPYEISVGLRQDEGRGISSFKLFPALDLLLAAEPPVIEDTWMQTDAEENPITEVRFTHPDQPKDARRYYRALGNVQNCVTVVNPPN